VEKWLWKCCATADPNGGRAVGNPEIVVKMPCIGFSGDYGCAGWRTRAEAIRKRDGDRCRGCNRGAEEIRIEVHHRIYGKPGAACGACLLTGVADADLVSLCADCHDAITSIRRRVRFAQREVVPIIVADSPLRSPAIAPRRPDIIVQPVKDEPIRCAIPVRRASAWEL
jgi:hypothetical protein